MRKPSILYVGQDVDIVSSFDSLLKQEGFDVHCVEYTREAVDLFSESSFDVTVVDLDIDDPWLNFTHLDFGHLLPLNQDWLYDKFRNLNPNGHIVTLTRYGNKPCPYSTTKLIYYSDPTELLETLNDLTSKFE